ncbi:MAG: tetratricopeptide repeat protein [Lachnospiraceae bacterium]|nr:tetratricopeptide repeat protein [Lachnospiraceae bacterium]
MSKDGMQEQVVVKKKNKIVLFAGILGVLLLVILGVVITPHIISANKERKINEQLESAQHFLDDLDYEQAIASYEAAIEIDPMSADAYLGLAAAYMSAGNYEKAMEILNLGYEKTENEVLLTQLQVFEEAMAFSGGADGQADGMVSGDVNVESNLPKVPETEIDGVIHLPYYEYDLTDQSKVFFDTLIDLFEESAYEEAVEVFTVESVNKVVQSIGDGYEVTVRIVYDNKKIYIDAGVDEAYMLIVPIDSGMGYGLRRRTNEYQNIDTYLYGYCSNGQFNGTYTCYEKSISAGNETIRQTQGLVSNGLLNGESKIHYDYETGGFAHVFNYNNGYLVYSDFNVSEGSYITYVKGKIIHDDGREVNFVDSFMADDVEQIEYQLNSSMHSIIYPLTGMVHVIEQNAEIKYLYW